MIGRMRPVAGAQGGDNTLTCYHGPTVHGPVVFVTRKPIPEGVSCQKSGTYCSFECSKATPPPSVDRVIRPRLKPPERLQR